MLNKRQTIGIAITVFSAGVLYCLAYGLILNHRTDYVGHFAAGFGGTIGLLTLVVASIRKPLPYCGLHLLALVVALISIGLGAILESTVFRIAQFDLIDFCNQSLGAVLAALSFTAARPYTPLRISAVSVGFAAAVVFLVAGFILAFA